MNEWMNDGLNRYLRFNMYKIQLFFYPHLLLLPPPHPGKQHPHPPSCPNQGLWVRSDSSLSPPHHIPPTTTSWGSHSIVCPQSHFFLLSASPPSNWEPPPPLTSTTQHLPDLRPLPPLHSTSLTCDPASALPCSQAHLHATAGRLSCKAKGIFLLVCLMPTSPPPVTSHSFYSRIQMFCWGYRWAVSPLVAGN